MSFKQSLGIALRPRIECTSPTSHPTLPNSEFVLNRKKHHFIF